MFHESSVSDPHKLARFVRGGILQGGCSTPGVDSAATGGLRLVSKWYYPRLDFESGKLD